MPLMSKCGLNAKELTLLLNEMRLHVESVSDIFLPVLSYPSLCAVTCEITVAGSII